METSLAQIRMSYNSTIVHALQKLNELRDISTLILFVEDQDKKVIGSLTDGDIRRSLVKDGNINKSVMEICNRNFVYRYEEDRFLNIKDLKKKHVLVLPILDKEHRLIGYIDLEKTIAVLPLECMIMAGGRGKRLSPLTDKIPKPMLPLGDKPILEHNIDRLISFGIKKIYISVKYLGEQIEEYFGDGSKKGISIEYIWEDEALGTAGALSHVPKFNTENVLLMNGDLFTNVDLEDMYLKLIEEEADMIVASTEYKVDIPYAILESKGQKVHSFKEKPSYTYHSNAGIYMLNKELINKIPKNTFFDITDLMDEIVAEDKKLFHFPIIGYWLDIGNPRDYIQAQEFVKHLK